MVLKSYLTLNYNCSDKEKKLFGFQQFHFEKKFDPVADQKQTLFSSLV